MKSNVSTVLGNGGTYPRVQQLFDLAHDIAILASMLGMAAT